MGEVGRPVTVYAKAATRPDGELAHEGNRVPDIAVLDRDTLVVAWRAGVADPHDDTPTDGGSILYARSADGGRTWLTGVLAEATATHRYHYAILLHDSGTLLAFLGRITVAEDRDAEGEVDGFPVELTAKRSRDRGRTWEDFPITVDVPRNSRGVVLAARPIRHGDVWLLPYWQQGGAGVLRSADLRAWRRGGLARPPRGMAVEEPQVVVSHDDPATLLMVARTLDLRGGTTPREKDAYYRTHAVYAAIATSADGGLTWSPMAVDRDIPNYYVKGLLARDGEGRYVAIYNTLGGPFQGERPDRYREVLHYKVKRPGSPWGPGRLFADGGRLTRGAARGWDVYPSAEEYAPGRFFVVWEHNQTAIKVATLDVRRSFTGARADAGGWEPAEGAVCDGNGIRLPGVATQAQAPRGAFLVTASGGGYALEVATGERRLTLDVRGPVRVAVTADGRATFLHDGTRLAVPRDGGPPRIRVFGPGPALVDRLEVGDLLAAWTQEVRLRSADARPDGIRLPIEPRDVTVEFLGEVLDDSALNPVTGHGVSLGVKAANGAKRLMMTVQRGTVWALVKGSARWRQVHAHPGGAAVWKVTVDSAGTARLYRDGRDTGATWVVQDSGEEPHASHWVTGTPGGNAAAARIRWSVVTATLSP
ncbi:sialidase family protein [Thermoactinospora rubra]|uniref:sialidase family protein n=1 Tax=Thermoactinospora rubra TaxID=1088767 RepID=UPI000A10AAFE|nr:sialidase family protein [Thermoactinospora rubra]